MIRVADDLDTGEFYGHLNKFLAAAVITNAENDQLTAAGVGRVAIDGTDLDPWSRYKTAGLAPETFKAVL